MWDTLVRAMGEVGAPARRARWSAASCCYRGGTWTIALVAGIVVALGGVVIVVNPFETTVTFVLVLGVLLVLKGAADLLVSLWLTSAMKQLQ